MSDIWLHILLLLGYQPEALGPSELHWHWSPGRAVASAVSVPVSDRPDSAAAGSPFLPRLPLDTDIRVSHQASADRGHRQTASFPDSSAALRVAFSRVLWRRDIQKWNLSWSIVLSWSFVLNFCLLFIRSAVTLSAIHRISSYLVLGFHNAPASLSEAGVDFILMLSPCLRVWTSHE